MASGGYIVRIGGRFFRICVGGDAHIAPAELSGVTEIFGKFVTSHGPMWASPPTNVPEDSPKT